MARQGKRRATEDDPVQLETAAAHVVTRVPVALETERVEALIFRLATEPYESLEAVYVTDAQGVFLGAVPLPALYRARRDQAVGGVAVRDYPRVQEVHDQEQVAAEALSSGASSVAVVELTGRWVGAVTATSLLEILRREHVEDLHRLAGIQREQVMERRALEAPPLRRARHRLPWLLIGLAGSMASAMLLSGFERVLEANLAVAFFVPAIVYLADAIGTQTEAIVVRGLSLSRLPLRQLLAGELRTGIFIGVTLATLAFPPVALVFGDTRLALSVSTAILAAGSVATTIGLLLPWVFARAGSDPAFGSGPVATIVQDVLSLLIYLLIVTMIMA